MTTEELAVVGPWIILIILIVISWCIQIDQENRREAGKTSRRNRRHPSNIGREQTSLPDWPLRLLGSEEERYRKEWGAHLLQLIDEGEVELARIHRQQFIRQAIVLTLVTRARRVLSRAR